MINEREEWRPVVGHEKTYLVSDTGRVKSLDRISGKRFLKGRIIKHGVDSGGYRRVGLYRYGKRAMKQISRLVAGAFLLDYSEELQVDHRDGNKLDDSSSNLRMLTRSQNGRAFQRKIKGCTSRFRGVSWCKRGGKWKAKLEFDGKTIHVGYFQNEEGAATAWNAKAIELGFQPEALNRV